jgi:glycosyltransferase involved in cell wall biosynthesis
MRIGIAGPIGTPDIEHLLDGDTRALPREMKGATLLGTLIASLIGLGHEVVAFTTDPALEPRRNNRVVAHGNRFAIHYVPRRRHGLRRDRGARGRMVDLFALERHALQSAIVEAHPDIVHAHWSYEFGWAALDSGIPCLLTCHDSPWDILKIQPDLYRLGRLFMAQSVLRRARFSTVVSPYLLDSLRRMTRAHLDVVPNPVSDDLFERGCERVSADWSSRPPRIAMILNGWSARKNPEPAMRALQAVRAVYPGAQMHLIGPGFGPDERAAAWASERGLVDQFVFHGWLPYAQAMDQLATMDLLVHPALEESFGMTIAEAMALGVPVVAGKDSGAVPWVCGGDRNAGLLVDVRASNAIVTAIGDLLGNASLYERCSREGRTRVRNHFAATAVARSYLEHYRRVLHISGATTALASGTET